MNDPNSSNVIDAEIISEEKIPERPRVKADATLLQETSRTAREVASSMDAIGASGIASKARVVADVADGARELGAALRPAGTAIGRFMNTLEKHGIVKMADRPPLRRPEPRRAESAGKVKRK